MKLEKGKEACNKSLALFSNIVTIGDEDAFRTRAHMTPESWRLFVLCGVMRKEDEEPLP